MVLHEYQLRLLSLTSVAQTLLQDLLVNSSEELLAQPTHLRQANRSAISCILGQYKGIFSQDAILKIPSNTKKVFDINGNPLQYPDVKTFDLSMVCALLRRIPDYMTHVPGKPNRCLNNCIQKCCKQCNHKHIKCNGCLYYYDECRFKKNLCCSQCQLCGFCQGTTPCEIYELKSNIDIIRRVRNISAHGNWNDFDNLEKNGTSLQNFPTCKTWIDLSKKIRNSIMGVISYMEGQQNFANSGKVIAPKQKDDYELEIKVALNGSPTIVERCFNETIFQLVTQMQESNETWGNLDNYVRDCLEKKLDNMDNMLVNHVNNFNLVDKRNEERLDYVKELITKTNISLTDGIEKILNTLKNYYSIDINAIKKNINIQQNEQVKIGKRIDDVETEVTNQKDDQIELKERLSSAETKLMLTGLETTKQRDEIQDVTERVKHVEDEIASKKDENVKIKERFVIAETEFASQKDEQVKIKERVGITEAEVSAQKNEQLKIKEKIKVAEHAINVIREEVKIQDSLQESLIDIKSNISYLRKEFEQQSTEQQHSDKMEYIHKESKNSTRTELITDDGSSHSFQVKESNWYLCCHHQQHSQPEKILHSFKREEYAPGVEKIPKNYESGDTKYYNELEYNEFLIGKFNEQFVNDVSEQPWVLTNLHEDCVDNRNFYDFCNEVYNFCNNKEHSFLLVDLSLEDNLRNQGFNIDKVKKVLEIYDEENTTNRPLVYIGEHSVILNMRYVDSSGRDDINDAVKKGQNDAKMFCSLYQDILQNSGITFESLVVTSTPKENLLEIDSCSKCVSENLIISDSELSTTLESIVEKRKAKEKDITTKISPLKTFLDLASRLWGTLSLKDVHLPNLCTSHNSALERIYLNRTQRRFLHSKRKHVILRGGYGSGKSVLALERFKQLLQNATENEYIYHICLDDETLFKEILKKGVSENVNHNLRQEQVFILNAEEYSKQFGLASIPSLAEILQDIKKRHKESNTKPNVIFDEYDSSNLTITEAHEIKAALSDLEKSYVLIVAQSLEPVRKRIIKKMFQKHKEKYESQKYEETGMSIVMLGSIMRNTNSINELTQVAIHELQKHKSSVYVHTSLINQNSSAASTPRNLIDTSEGTVPIISRINERKERENSSSYNVQLAQKVSDSDSKFHLKANSSTNMSLKPESEKLDDKTTTIKSYGTRMERIEDSQHITKLQGDKTDSDDGQVKVTFANERTRLYNKIPSANFYHVLKIMNLDGHESSDTVIESTFRYPGLGKHGHKVQGILPLLINPFENMNINYDNINDEEVKKRMLFTLQNLLRIKERSDGLAAIIVFEPIEAQFFHATLSSMDINTVVYTPAIYTGITQSNPGHLAKQLKNNVLITDHLGCRGLEFKYLIVTINPNDVYLYQYLVEAFTRCLFELTFIVFTTGIKMKNAFSSDDIIKVWKKNKLIKEYMIRICEKHDEDGEFLQPFCQPTKMVYCIHPWHDDLLKIEIIGTIAKYTKYHARIDYEYNRIISTDFAEEVKRKEEEQDLYLICSSKGYRTNADIIRGNDANIVDMLMKCCESNKELLNSQDVYGNSLLDIALEHGCNESIKSIIRSGLKFSIQEKKTYNVLTQNTQNEFGKTPLHLAIENKQDYIADFLIQHGCKLDVLYDDGNAALHNAVRKGWTNVVKKILDKDPKIVDIQNRLGQTPLHVTVENEKDNLADLLIQHGCKLDVLDNDGNAALHNAVSKGWTNVVKAILEKNPQVIDIQNKWGKTPLHLAVENEKVDLFNLFIQHGSKQDAVDKYGNTVLHNVVRNGWTDVAKTILEKTPQIVDIQNKRGQTPLHIAVDNRYDDLVDFLIQIGCKVGAVDKDGDTALHNAVRKGWTDVVKTILEKNSETTDVKNELGKTPLHLVIENEKVDLADLLLQHGCKVDAEDKYGNTALHKAVSKGWTDMVKTILEKNPQIIDIQNKRVQTPLHIAVDNRYDDLVDFLIQIGCKVGAVDEDGDTALHNAVRKGWTDVVKTILEKNSETIDVKNELGKTPLHLVIENEKVNLADLLLQHGCKVDAEDKYGNTALHKAVSKGWTDMVEKILEKNPQIIDIKNKLGKTPRDLAIEKNNEDLSNLLIQHGSTSCYTVY